MGWYASDDAFLNMFEGKGFDELCDTLLTEHPDPPPAVHSDPESPDGMDDVQSSSQHVLVEVSYKGTAEDSRSISRRRPPSPTQEQVAKKYARIAEELQEREHVLQAQAQQMSVDRAQAESLAQATELEAESRAEAHLQAAMLEAEKHRMASNEWLRAAEVVISEQWKNLEEQTREAQLWQEQVEERNSEELQAAQLAAEQATQAAES